jgi:hypothetical protein
MGLFNRFFGSSDAPQNRGEQLVANPAKGEKIGLQLLFDRPLALDADSLRKALRSWHPELAKAACEIDPATIAQGTPLGLAGWGEHVIQIVGFNVPMPAEPVEKCIQPAHYGADLKEKARAHQAHLLLFYAGYEESRVEQFVALAAVAAVLAQFGAIVVLNEGAHTSLPTLALSADPKEDDRMDLLRNLPLLILYAGFVKYTVDGTDGVWMRTYGLPELGLPDLATLTAGHHEGNSTFEMFSDVLAYVMETEAHMAAGHTMQLGADLFLRLRAPTEDEYFLESTGELFVAELIPASEVNP